jgi:peptidyl-prolyl cis-trans isomerase SurA
MMNKVLVAPLVVLFGLALAAGPAAQQGVILQKVIVRVNGEIFTQSDLEYQQILALRNQNRQVRSSLDLATDPGLRAALAQVTPKILLEAVEKLLLVQHGREIGLKFNDEMFNRALDDLKKANDIKDDATLQIALKQEGMTMNDLRITIEQGWIEQGVMQKELGRNLTLTDEELRQYYKAHPEEFMKPSTVTLREIFIAVPTDATGAVNAAAEEAAREKIAAIRERALKGEDYTKLVAEVSESATKSAGGLIGPINIDDLSETISKAISGLKQGDVAEPLRTRTGYQLIKLESRSTSESEPFEASRERIQQRIIESRIEVERAKFVERLHTQAVIEWKDDAYRKLYEAARAERLKQK